MGAALQQLVHVELAGEHYIDLPMQGLAACLFPELTFVLVDALAISLFRMPSPKSRFAS
jgi:hypothetical protein